MLEAVLEEWLKDSWDCDFQMVQKMKVKKRYIKNTEWSHEPGAGTLGAVLCVIFGFVLIGTVLFIEAKSIWNALDPLGKAWVTCGLILLSFAWLAVLDLRRKVWWEEQ
jgi:hypothetical protein